MIRPAGRRSFGIIDQFWLDASGYKEMIGDGG
jgi:hypothetical protein